MVIRIQTTIFCDICGNRISAPLASSEKQDQVRQLAEKAGWEKALPRADGTLRDHCPRCLSTSIEERRDLLEAMGDFVPRND